MKSFYTLDQVEAALGDGGSFNPNQSFSTVGQLVDALVNLGNTDKVLSQHDDHRSLKSRLSEKFLGSHLENVDTDEFDLEIREVLDQASIIFRHWEA